MSTRRQSDPFEVTQTCSWRPELLHPTCADGPRPGPSPALSAQQTLPEHRRKVAWLLCSLRAPRELAGWTSREVGEAAGEAAGCGRLVGRLSPLPERGPRSLEAPCARPVPGSPLCARGAREPPISLRIFFAPPKS